MNTRYQLIFIGNQNDFKDEIESEFMERISDLGLKKGTISVLNSNDFDQYEKNAPSVCLYFGGNSPFPDSNIVQRLIDDACLVIPIVDNLKTYTSNIPEILRPINGFELNSDNAANRIPALVSRILEGLMLLRKSRRLFISYRRIESRSVALQLYGFLDERGFNVFLDTHSIGPGALFQDELWHSLADTDVLLLLNTKNFVGNKWTDEELAKAATMSVGIIQLVWPNCENGAFVQRTAFASPVYLQETDFTNNQFINENSKLTDQFLLSIETDLETFRARALVARQNKLVKEFIKAADDLKISATLQSEKVIILTCQSKKVAVVPTVGIPDIYTSFERENLIREIWKNDVDEVWIVYDHRNVLSKYLVFVGWLGPLSVKFKKISDVDNVLKTECL